MKPLKIFLIALLLFGFTTTSAKDYKGQKCCPICVEWIENSHGFVKCIKWEMKCPCPYPTPAFEFHQNYGAQESWIPQDQHFSVFKSSILPEEVIDKIPKKQKKWLMNLIYKYSWILAIVPALILFRKIFFWWR